MFFASAHELEDKPTKRCIEYGLFWLYCKHWGLEMTERGIDRLMAEMDTFDNVELKLIVLEKACVRAGMSWKDIQRQFEGLYEMRQIRARIETTTIPKSTPKPTPPVMPLPSAPEGPEKTTRTCKQRLIPRLLCMKWTIALSQTELDNLMAEIQTVRVLNSEL